MKTKNIKNIKKSNRKEYLSDELHQELANLVIVNFFKDFDLSSYGDIYGDFVNIVSTDEATFNEKHINAKLLANQIYQILPKFAQNKDNKNYLIDSCEYYAMDHELNVEDYENNREEFEQQKKHRSKKLDFKKSLSPEQLKALEELYENKF